MVFVTDRDAGISRHIRDTVVSIYLQQIETLEAPRIIELYSIGSIRQFKSHLGRCGCLSRVVQFPRACFAPL
jgi:hypothetical protein